jgi:hypothetical protein
LPRPSSALKPSHSPDSVACPGLGGICLAFDETLRVYFVLLRRFRIGLCVVSCELVLCAKVLIHPSLRSLGTQSCMCFSIGNLKLLELLEAPFDNISVVSGVFFVLRRILNGRNGSIWYFDVAQLVTGCMFTTKFTVIAGFRLIVQCSARFEKFVFLKLVFRIRDLRKTLLALCFV